MTELELRQLKVALNRRLDEFRTEVMKPDFDDSMTGYNECWDQVRKFLDEQIAKLESRP